MHFSNPFGMTFTLNLNLPSFAYLDRNHIFLSCEIQQEFCDLIKPWYYNFYEQDLYIVQWYGHYNNYNKLNKITINSITAREQISCCNITLNINIITNPTFSRVLKIFIIFFSHYKFLVNFLFITSIQYWLSSTILLIKL